jgi:hypothetical protein
MMHGVPRPGRAGTSNTEHVRIQASRFHRILQAVVFEPGNPTVRCEERPESMEIARSRTSPLPPPAST